MSVLMETVVLTLVKLSADSLRRSSALKWLLEKQMLGYQSMVG